SPPSSRRPSSTPSSETTPSWETPAPDDVGWALPPAGGGRGGLTGPPVGHRGNSTAFEPPCIPARCSVLRFAPAATGNVTLPPRRLQIAVDMRPPRANDLRFAPVMRLTLGHVRSGRRKALGATWTSAMAH